jgi:hypothetical protein
MNTSPAGKLNVFRVHSIQRLSGDSAFSVSLVNDYNTFFTILVGTSDDDNQSWPAITPRLSDGIATIAHLTGIEPEAIRARLEALAPGEYVHNPTFPEVDPFNPDWSRAPKEAVAWAVDANGTCYWYCIEQVDRCFTKHFEFDKELPPHPRWKESLRIRPTNTPE